jgi:meiotically up-regulated gene 157 (Mug157) protein
MIGAAAQRSLRFMTSAFSRRTAAFLLGAVFAASAIVPAPAQTLNIPVESQIRPIQTAILYQQLFYNFFPESDGTTYVQTGDIPAMWLRDSSAQTIPYIRFANAYPTLRYTFSGVLQRDARNILVDPHAEAFSADYHVWEGKWEIDSLAWPVLLAFTYYANTHDRTIFTPVLHRAMQTIVATLQCEQHHAACSHYVWPHPVPTVERYNPDTGMIWSAFRPSDDPVEYRFNIPQNAMAVVAMRLLADFARDAFADDKLAAQAQTLAAQIQVGIERYGRTWVPGVGWMYVYETDGYGHDNLMDDANIPNLTALPWIGWCATDDPVYLNTRHFTLSSKDPYYYSGKYATGLGSPHTPKGWVWPLGLIGAALSTRKKATIASNIDMLDRSDTLNGLMHESVNPNDPSQFTRPEFGWANAFWADLLFRSVAGYRAIPFVTGDTIVPLEQVSEIPAITSLGTQFGNTAELNMTLGDLLAQHPPI